MVLIGCCEAVIAIFFPPLAVLLRKGCSGSLLINIILTLLGWIPGVIHAWFVIAADTAVDTTTADTMGTALRTPDVIITTIMGVAIRADITRGLLGRAMIAMAMGVGLPRRSMEGRL